MKPPLRELVVGTDIDRAKIPDSDLAFLRELGGPALIRLAGRDRSRVRVVSTLLHGNEPSGLRAIHRFLRSTDVPATDVLLFVAAVGTALEAPGFAHRALRGERDGNRCWMPPWDGPQGEVARTVLDRILALQPECLVDLHNNTGHNPAYGVAFRLGHAEVSLVSLFADRVVHTPIELGTIVEATVPHFPSVTVECGRAGDAVADEVAWTGLRRYLDWDEIDFARPLVPLLHLENPVRVCVRPGAELAFADEGAPAVALTISSDIDRHNFERLPAGTAIGWVGVDADWPLAAIGADGADCSRAMFEIDAGTLRSRHDFIPIMMTTDREIAKSDCLFYAVQLAAGEEQGGES